MKLLVTLTFLLISSLAFSQSFVHFSLDTLTSKQLIFKKDLSLKSQSDKFKLSNAPFLISTLKLSTHDIMISKSDARSSSTGSMPCLVPSKSGTMSCLNPKNIGLMPIIHPTNNKFALIQDVR